MEQPLPQPWELQQIAYRVAPLPQNIARPPRGRWSTRQTVPALSAITSMPLNLIEQRAGLNGRHVLSSTQRAAGGRCPDR